ncbi:MAG: putative transporter, ATP-binding protein [Gammaproteobacteria bacterium]|jgi:ATP-binding cassette subfamily F protein 3|nr:putative transporter, ATP-binding protein [Gammaproteobacteria bacterium]
MIKLINISLQRGLKQLLDETSLTLLSGQKVGIIGENGAGKSSLFALLTGKLTPDLGDVFLPKHLKIAHLEQEVPALEQTAIEYVIDGDQELRALEKRLSETDDGVEIAEIYTRMETIGAYSANARAAQLMYGLGFTTEEQQYRVSQFSGGWRMRLNLARTLMCRSDLLLLDEPTNHLDLDAIIWLEAWLKTYPGTLLFISHDRDFLDAIASHIVHLDNRQLKLYTGDYSAFEQQRAANLAQQQATYEKQQRDRAHLQGYIERFRAKASKARQAQSRIKALERMDIIQAVHVNSAFQFSFREAPPCSNPLLKLDKADLGYENKTVLQNVSVNLMGQARIGLIGPNGAGKSTLIKCLAGELIPLIGELFINPKVRIGYFSQHQLDSLDLNASPLLHLQRLSPEASQQDLRNYLGSFGFSNEQALTPVGPFSGGEKSRLALALLIWQRPNLLLLDEPTNHLDLEMREALTLALQNYQGAMIVVSHDRHLLRSCTDELILVANQRVKDFDGDLEDYEKWLQEYRRDMTQAKTPTIATSQQSQQSNKQQRALKAKLEKIEKQMEIIVQQKKQLEEKLADSALYIAQENAGLKNLLAEQDKLLQQEKILEQEWLDLQD